MNDDAAVRDWLKAHTAMMDKEKELFDLMQRVVDGEDVMALVRQTSDELDALRALVWSALAKAFPGKAQG